LGDCSSSADHSWILKPPCGGRESEWAESDAGKEEKRNELKG